MVRVLQIEDNLADAGLVSELLASAGRPEIELVQADRIADGLEGLQEGRIDAMLLDLGLPDSQGVETIRRVHDCAPHVPVIVLSGEQDTDLAVSAVEAGAQDYLPKGEIDGASLVRAIYYAIQRQRLIAELKQTAHELEARNGELESFTYSVSHDLKEPLRTLEAFSQFLIEDHSAHLDAEGRDYLERITKASGRLKQMIEELLLLSRLSRPPEEVDRVNVQHVVRDIVASMSVVIEERNARVEVEDVLPETMGDQSRVEQIFGNLITNGLKFNSSDRPTVSIGARPVDGDRATYIVRDNGIGIEEQYQERIFGVFQQLHRREQYGGTGAGLAIVQRAVAALGGEIRVESALGSGSAFYVTLPVAEAAGRSADAA